jgi:hypothetical protein
MLVPLSKYGKLLILPLVALAIFLGAYFYFYRGTYDPPPDLSVPYQRLAPPASVHTTFTEVPEIHRGTLLVDGAHRNDFSPEEITSLLSRIADRGHNVTFIGEPSAFGGFRRLDAGERKTQLEERLRESGSFAVIAPDDPFSREEIDTVERFVAKGGRLLLIADPTRSNQINTLAERFGITFRPDHLYNTVEYDLNFQNIKVRNFQPHPLTQGLREVVLYTAGSVSSASPGLAFTDGNTRSSMVERIEPFYPIVAGAEGRVVAISDLTFMVPPQNSILDNDRLISNIADYLTASERRFNLDDFPHFFRSEVDILLGRSSLFDVGTSMKTLLSGFRLNSEIRGVEDITRDTVFLGLYEDASDVAQYLQVAGIQLGGTLRTPFSTDIKREDTALMLLHNGQQRHVLAVLGDSQSSLVDIVAQLNSGNFRDGLVSDTIGVYKTP